MKKLLFFTFIFTLIISNLAYAQNGKKKGSSKYISISQAEEIAKDALSTIKGYTIKEIKEIKKKKASSFEAVLADSFNGNNLSFFITNKGVITGPALNGELMKSPARKKGAEKIKSAEQAELAVKEYLQNYNGFMIDGVKLIEKGPNETDKAKKFSVVVKDKHDNTYFIRVTPSGVRPQGLVSEGQMAKNEAVKAKEVKEKEEEIKKKDEERKEKKEKNLINKDKKIYKDKQKKQDKKQNKAS